MNGNESNQGPDVREANLMAGQSQGVFGGEQVVSRNVAEVANQVNKNSEWGMGDVPAGLGRERAGVIGSAVLSKEGLGSASLSNGSGERIWSEPTNEAGREEQIRQLETETPEQRWNNEQIEQIVTAENNQAAEKRFADTRSTLPEALMMPEVQGKVDKATVKIISQIVEKKGNQPGILDSEVNEWRRRYQVSQRTNQ